jgi:hypothetical protein
MAVIPTMCVACGWNFASLERKNYNTLINKVYRRKRSMKKIWLTKKIKGIEKKIREMECKSNTRSRNIKRQECVSMLMRKYVMYGGFI